MSDNTYTVTVETQEGEWAEEMAYIYVVSAEDKKTARLRAARHATPNDLDIDPECYTEDDHKVVDVCDSTETGMFVVLTAHVTQLNTVWSRGAGADLDDYLIPLAVGNSRIYGDVSAGFKFDFDESDINQAPGGDEFGSRWTL